MTTFREWWNQRTHLWQDMPVIAAEQAWDEREREVTRLQLAFTSLRDTAKGNGQFGMADWINAVLAGAQLPGGGLTARVL